MGQVDWRPVGSGRRFVNGYVGDVLFACVEPHDLNPEAFSLLTSLPGGGGLHLPQYETLEDAKGYFEEVFLPDWLKKAGLQFRPTTKSKKNRVNKES